MEQRSGTNGAGIALACGVLGVLTAVWIYWMVLPGVVFGLAAILLGWRAHRRDAGSMAAAALALGIVAVLLVPSVLVVANEAEDFGHDCALNPSNEDC
jgi:hypothetical protein